MDGHGKSQQQPPQQPAREADWLVGQGEMVDRVRAFDWSRTPLGPIGGWPQSLKVAVGICLNSRFPMFVWWGPDLINIYNDAYVPMLGKRHPSALGRPAHASWGDIWSVVGPQADAVMGRGEATWNDRVKLVMERHGFVEETWFTWSYSPITDATGKVGGLYCAVTEETPRVLAEAERDRLLGQLAAERAKLDEVFQRSPSFMAILRGSDHVFELANERYYQLVGRRDIIGKPVVEAIPEIGGQGFIEILDRVYRTGEPFVGRSMRALLRRNPGQPPQEVIIEVVYQPLREADGTVSGIFAHGVDLTEHKLAEAALRESEERFRAAFEQAAVGMVLADLEGRLLRANDAFCRIVGRTQAELIGHDTRAYTHPEDQDPNAEQVRRVASAVATSAIYEKRFIRGDGATVWAQLSLSPLRDAAGRPERLIAVVEDVTERVEAAAQLVEDAQAIETINRVGLTVAAELDLQKLVQAVVDATTELTRAQFGAFFYNVIDEKGESYSLYSIAGVPREHFDKFPMPRNTGIFAPTFAGAGVVRLDDVTADPRYGRNAPHRGMPPGHLPVRSYLAVPVVSRSGEVLGGLFFGHSEVGVFGERAERVVAGIAAQAAIGIDNARLFDSVRRATAEKERLLLSERSAREEVERASRMKDEFLATLSHELRTPLNAILGWSQILRAGAAHVAGDYADDLRDGLNTIERNARAQTQIIEDLLDMSRIVSGKVRLDVQRVDLAQVVRAAIETVRPAADAKGVRVVPILDPLARPVSGDPNRLQQVFWNLLSNAVKFTPRGGQVQVVLERVNSHLEVSVIDTGEGIEASFLPHVFDRFRQADASTTRRHGGLGLGLAIARQLIELHGGTIRAKSAGRGQGSTFVVSLPILAIHAEPDPESALDRRHPGAGEPPMLPDACALVAGVKVLVVDDEPDARALVRRLLTDCDATVTTASSAAEAFELLRAQRPDVFVSDIGMPGEDGYSLIRRIRALPPSEGGETPAVALTAYARAEDRVKAIVAGFQMHVTKPVEPAELIAMVASLAGRTGRVRQ